MAKRDYYEVLGVPRNAGTDEIKKAYRKLAMQHHPDRNPDNPVAEEKFKEASEAYSVLADEQKRRTYNQFGHDGLKMGGRGFNDFFSDSIFTDFEDILGGFFGFNSSRSRGQSRGPRRGRDMGMEVGLTLEEAYKGIEKEVEIKREINCDVCGGSGSEPGYSPDRCEQCGGAGTIRRSQGFFSVATTCSRCNGTGQMIKHPCKKCHGNGRIQEQRRIKVNFPAGIDTGQRLRANGEGEGGYNGGRPGDLYLIAQVEEDNRFSRQDNDLLYKLDITFSQAALGDDLKIHTFSGTEKIKIPPETQNGKIIRLKGKGFNHIGSWGKGDLVVIVNVLTPVKIGKRERDIFRELREIELGKSKSAHLEMSDHLN